MKTMAAVILAMFTVMTAEAGPQSGERLHSPRSRFSLSLVRHTFYCAFR